MSETASLRRLIDLPGVDDLELKALMKPRLADPGRHLNPGKILPD